LVQHGKLFRLNVIATFKTIMSKKKLFGFGYNSCHFSHCTLMNSSVSSLIRLNFNQPCMVSFLCLSVNEALLLDSNTFFKFVLSLWSNIYYELQF
jgi:hypothetical protein